jgi:hypothetical protein
VHLAGCLSEDLNISSVTLVVSSPDRPELYSYTCRVVQVCASPYCAFLKQIVVTWCDVQKGTGVTPLSGSRYIVSAPR